MELIALCGYFGGLVGRGWGGVVVVFKGTRRLMRLKDRATNSITEQHRDQIEALFLNKMRYLRSGSTHIV